VIPNPIDLSEITLKPDSKSQTEASIKLIAVGRLDEIKDYPTMIRAVGLLRNTYKVSLDIIGDGNIKESLINLINELNLAEHITLVGEVLELSHWYREADVLVLSSLSEGFGNVIVEALAHGTPVVSTDCPSGPSDIITENTYGRLVPVGDFVALADAIIQVRLQAIDKKILRARAEDFECSKICDAYKKVLIKKNCDY
jgi:glycosyltransferase involved in cell wall biosynthesis